MMNTQARKLGMLNTNFVNSSGLPHPDHYTTAEDIAKVAIATIRNFPEYYSWYSEKDFEFNGIRQSNRNKLLWKDKSVDGLKTGHTEAAGYCLVSSAKREGMRLLSVVMGTNSMKSREEESLKLLNYGFRFFETHKLYSAGDTLSTAKIWKGASDRLPVGINNDLFITIPRNQYDKLEASIELNSLITAPISENQQLGNLIINLSGDTLIEQPLVALNAVAEGGFFGNLIDNVMMMLE
jgi:D-alanyl-D-alanine carboxypeptidase (penicillin-binding protein 5/6)